MSATFFTSDHHFGHDNILRYCAQTRPFRSLQVMHEHYVERWNAVVRPQDTVWYLGDFSMKFPFVPEFLPQMHGTKHLVVGNHDKCFKLMPQQVGQYLQAGFASVQAQQVLQLEGLTFVLSHFPYRVAPERRSADPDIAMRQERYAPASVEAGKHDEVALIHGHVHNLWRARVGAAQLPELNMGADAWDSTPVRESRVLALYRDAVTRAAPAQMDWQGRWGPLPKEGAGE